MRAYRALERAAIAAGSQALLIVHPIYMDDAAPALIELGFWDNGQVESAIFRNRFDTHELAGADRFDAALACATNAEAAALGEETVRALIETEWDGVLLDSDDAAGERDGHRHGLDLLMLVDGEVVAFEVKTRHVSRDAGRLTRAGTFVGRAFESLAGMVFVKAVTSTLRRARMSASTLVKTAATPNPRSS